MRNEGGCPAHVRNCRWSIPRQMTRLPRDRQSSIPLSALRRRPCTTPAHRAVAGTLAQPHPAQSRGGSEAVRVVSNQILAASPRSACSALSGYVTGIFGNREEPSLRQTVRGEPCRSPGRRCPTEPRILNHLGQFLQCQIANPTCPQQHRRMSVEMRRGKERRRRVLNHCLLVGIGGHPEHDHVRIPFTGTRVEGIGARRSEEHERFAADLIDRIAPRPTFDRDMGHTQGQLVHIVHPCAARNCRHRNIIERDPQARESHVGTMRNEGIRGAAVRFARTRPETYPVSQGPRRH